MSTRQTFTWSEKLPTLGAKGLVLRALESRDITALYEIFGDPEVTRYWSSPPLDSVQAAERLLAEIHSGFSERRSLRWGIADADTETVIGTCTLLHFEMDHRRCELGYALARKRWGRGEASRAITAVLEFAFDILGLHRIEADVDPRNEKSLRLLERLGFKHEGVLRERYHLNGEVQDAAILGLLRRDWRGGALESRPLRQT